LEGLSNVELFSTSSSVSRAVSDSSIATSRPAFDHTGIHIFRIC
jgi:hypothetical protein